MNVQVERGKEKESEADSAAECRAECGAGSHDCKIVTRAETKSQTLNR